MTSRRPWSARSPFLHPWISPWATSPPARSSPAGTPMSGPQAMASVRMAPFRGPSPGHCVGPKGRVLSVDYPTGDEEGRVHLESRWPFEDPARPWGSRPPSGCGRGSGVLGPWRTQGFGSGMSTIQRAAFPGGRSVGDGQRFGTARGTPTVDRGIGRSRRPGGIFPDAPSVCPGCSTVLGRALKSPGGQGIPLDRKVHRG